MTRQDFRKRFDAAVCDSRLELESLLRLMAAIETRLNAQAPDDAPPSPREEPAPARGAA